MFWVACLPCLHPQKGPGLGPAPGAEFGHDLVQEQDLDLSRTWDLVQGLDQDLVQDQQRNIRVVDVPGRNGLK